MLHLHHSSMIKSSKEVANQLKVFLTIFAWWWKDPDPYLWLADLDPGGPKTYWSSGSGILDAIPWRFFAILKWRLCRIFVNSRPAPSVGSRSSVIVYLFRQIRTEIALSAHSSRIGAIYMKLGRGSGRQNFINRIRNFIRRPISTI